MTPLLSANNPRLRALRRLSTQRRVRRAETTTLVEGPTLVAEALVWAPERIVEVFTEVPLDERSEQAARAADVPVTLVAGGALAKVLDTVTPQPVVACVSVPVHTMADLGHDRPVIVAVDLRDPGNLGTLLRAAEASGCAGLVLVGHCVDPSSPKVVRAAAGAWLRSVVIEMADPLAAFAELRAGGRTVVASALVPNASTMWEVDLTDAAIVLGNEAHGLADDVVAAADDVVFIPMDGPTESLNVAVAGALLAFEGLRQRQRRMM